MQDMGFIAGLNVMEANRPISQKLKEKGLMFRQETVEHSYPFCWRTDTPLIYKPISTWFVKVESFRDRMVEHNRKVHWVPGHIRDGRFGKWLENARDWAISRNRFWGTPLPIWKSEDGDTLCFGSVEELEKASGTEVPDLHKQHVDQLVIEHQGKTYRRVTEVLDCWFESGSMPYGQQHYPFENKEVFEANFPANFICEGLDQTRGWFYTLVVIAQALFDKPAFHNCVVNGLILAEDGKKMSKRLKNYPDPTQMLDQYGADAIRLYMLNSPAVRGEDLRFSEKGLVETTRTLLLPLWNALAFLTTYARIDGWEPTSENLELPRNNPLDLWILSKLAGLIDEVRTQMDLYDLNRSVAPFVGFIDLLTNWYIRRSRRRFWKAGQGSDKLEAYATLFQVLRNLSRVIAPFVPFIADGIHRALKQPGDPESVHLCLFPEKEAQMNRDSDLEQRMELVLSAVTMGRALRAKHQLKIRQPLRKITLITATPEAQRILEDLGELITDELNVKSVEISRDEKDLVELSAKANFKLLGRRMGKKMKSVSQAIAAMSPAQIRDYLQQGSIELMVDQEPTRFENEEILVQRNQKEGLLVETDNLLTVALDTEINEELMQEGLAREFVNKVQNMRKEKNLDVMDRIVTRYRGSKVLESSLETHSDFIRTETLTNILSSESVLEGEDWDLNGEACRIFIEKAA
jgi:isoleucyl-tRNA synthetase